jgi:integrase
MASTAWRNARERAGLDDEVTQHTLRHTRATWLMQKGVPLKQAADHLGMTMLMLQRNYAHHCPDWQQEAADV